MPPKQPALRFRPKLIVRAPQPDVTAASSSSPGADNSASSPSSSLASRSHRDAGTTAMSSSSSSAADVDMDDLTLVQLERLRRVQQQQQHQQQQQTAGGAVGAVPAHGGTTTTSATSGGDGVSKDGATSHNARHASAATRSTAGRFATTTTTTAANAAARMPGYAHAALYPATAPPLPVNTMQRIALDGDGSRDGASSPLAAAATVGVTSGPHTTVYAPIPLDRSAALHEANVTTAAAAAAAASTDAQAGGDTTTADDGTAFLRAWHDETRASRAANLRFYHSTLAPLCGAAEVTHDGRGVGGGGDSGDDHDNNEEDAPLLPSHTTATTLPSQQQQQQRSSGGGGGGGDKDDDGALVWLQLPRFHTSTPPFTLAQLPPGKVGEMKVLRSGRIILDIAGVHYDVAVEDNTAGNASSTVAVATVPPTQPADPTSHAACYELGALQSKLICTPALDKCL